jgi:hypothetical protein
MIRLQKLQENLPIVFLEPERDAESSLEKVDTFNKKDLDGNWLNNPYLLQLILKEVQNVRQEWFSVNVRCGKEKPGYWEKVARRIDQAYFCLYLITTISFLIFISFMWLH